MEMENVVNKACGIDVHKKFLKVAIATRGIKDIVVRRFETTLDELWKLRDWLIDEQVERVAMESTGIYWLRVYRILENDFEVIVGNARDIKNLKKKKTDKRDAKWIALLCLNDLIEPSIVPTKHQEKMRDLVRQRVHFTQLMTSCKNKVIQYLDNANIQLSKALSDTFGKSGRIILENILSGFSDEAIFIGVKDKRILKRKDEILSCISGNVDSNDVFLIQQNLEAIETFQKQIELIDSHFVGNIEEDINEIKILLSVPGVQFVSAVSLNYEIGEINKFPTPPQLPSWCGLVPSANSTGGKHRNGKITKTGNKYVRRVMAQVANAIIKRKRGTLYQFFMRIKSRRGHNKAIIALARKVLEIIHHLLSNQEFYEEEQHTKKIIIPKIKRKVDINKNRLQILIKTKQKLGELNNTKYCIKSLS